MWMQFFMMVVLSNFEPTSRGQILVVLLLYIQQINAWNHIMQSNIQTTRMRQ